MFELYQLWNRGETTRLEFEHVDEILDEFGLRIEWWKCLERIG